MTIKLERIGAEAIKDRLGGRGNAKPAVKGRGEKRVDRETPDKEDVGGKGNKS
jgi:hypothetical protein